MKRRRSGRSRDGARTDAPPPEAREPAPVPLRGRDLALAGLMIAAAWALLFAPQLFAGRIFVSSDAAAFRPFAEFSRERWLLLHQRTFWNPYVFLGLPGSASLADARPQYLPDAWLSVWDLATARVPLLLPMLAHLAGMLGMAALARAVWGVGLPAMVWAAFAWGLLPNLLVPLALGHDAQLMAISLTPPVLLAAHGVLAAARPAGFVSAALGLALAIALVLVSGHPQIAAYAAALAALFACERAARFGRPRRLALVALAAGLGLALAAPVWYPALRYVAQSVRGGAAGGITASEVAAWSLAWRDFASFVWPFAVGSAWPTYWGGLAYTDYPPYFGVTVCGFVLLALPRRGEAARGLVLVLLGASAAAWLLSLGVHLGLPFTLLRRYVPFLGGFRVAVAVLIVAQLAFVLLAARGLDRALRAAWIDRVGRRVAVACGAGLAIALLAAVTLRFGPLREPYAQAVLAARPEMEAGVADRAARRAGEDLALRALLVAGVLAALVVRRRVKALSRPATVAIVGLLAADLLTVSAPILLRTSGEPARLAASPPSALAKAASEDPAARALALDRPAFYSNEWIGWRVRSVSGYHGAVSRAWQELFHARFDITGVSRAVGVRFVGGAAARAFGPPDYEPVGDPREGVRRLLGAPGRAYAVPEVVDLGREADVLDAMHSSGFDPLRQALVVGGAAAGRYPGSEGCAMRWLRDDPDSLALEVRTPAPTFVVIADAYFPGWRATVDGRPATIQRVDHVLRGVGVPAGRHRLAMSYEPEGWRIGRRAAAVGVMVWLVVALACSLVVGRDALGTRR